MTEDQGKENSPSDRLDEIKSEEKEDASSYYAQGESKDNVNEEAELSKPVEDVDAQKEEMNMLKAVAFLGFGMAALAIIFILFFVCMSFGTRKSEAKNLYHISGTKQHGMICCS